MCHHKGNYCSAYLNVTKAEPKLSWERVHGGQLTEMHYGRLKIELTCACRPTRGKYGLGEGRLCCMLGYYNIFF
jgi:hypothetical protein